MIEPVLTAEQWEHLPNPFKRDSDVLVKIGPEPWPEDHPDRHYAGTFSVSMRAGDSPIAMALANAALPDHDPRKFTWADFDMWTGRNPEAQIVADKIRALLPPRDVPRASG